MNRFEEIVGKTVAAVKRQKLSNHDDKGLFIFGAG
jgi:hypothetical protein